MLSLLAACAGTPPELARPNRLALGPDGSVYVSDFHHTRIVVFDAQGRFVRTFGERGIGYGDLWRVTAMAPGADGHLLVANRRPETEDADSDQQFEVVDFEDGQEVGRTPIDGRALQPEGWVDAIAVLPDRLAPDGQLVLADSTNGELIEVDATGARIGRYGGSPRVDAAPSGLRRVGDELWVVEQYRHRIGRIAPDQSEEILALDPHHELPRFPSAVGVCPGRWVAVADLAGHRVQRYALDGRWLGGFEPEAVGPDSPVELLDLDVSADCQRLYLVDSKGDRVLVTDPDGAVLQVLQRW